MLQSRCFGAAAGPRCAIAKRQTVIQVTRFNGSKLYVNAEMIRFVEGTPDTVISLMDGTKIVVRESAEKVVAEVIAYRQHVNRPAAPEAKEA